jgi:hypothetical protein
VAIERALEANSWAQVGSAAVAWELSKLGVRPLSSCARSSGSCGAPGIRRRERRARCAAQGTPCPAPLVVGANDCQELDIIGPRYLGGGVLFFVLALVDLGRPRDQATLRPRDVSRHFRRNYEIGARV